MSNDDRVSFFLKVFQNQLKNNLDAYNKRHWGDPKKKESASISLEEIEDEIVKLKAFLEEFHPD
ncbi:MAG: hypothetical protein HeimC3_46480 [Candidatus Heimdallarchaeota archaeon LC_3]|nr:MAG: hypothetical protein HeimC3_46480 [Candidatus Heimdallarchaeota archaeon LC_3]